MTGTNLYPLLAGMVSMAALVAALLFLRYWRRSGDRLFLFFCIAFLLDAGVCLVQGLVTVAEDHEAWLFLPRLATFALIAWGIVDKNRRAGKK